MEEMAVVVEEIGVSGPPWPDLGQVSNEFEEAEATAAAAFWGETWPREKEAP